MCNGYHWWFGCGNKASRVAKYKYRTKKILI